MSALRNVILAVFVFTLASVNAACVGKATYCLTFHADWTAAKHPTDYPSSAHWSRLVGAAHKTVNEIWYEGGTATDGVKDVAEQGKNGEIEDEVEDAIDAGQAGLFILGSNVANGAGTGTATFSVDATHHYATIITMVAPSPDWFAGTNSLDMCNGTEWVTQLDYTLFPWDAGTDGGTTFTSDDLPLDPRQAIAKLVAPFTEGVDVGYFEFDLTDTDPTGRLDAGSALRPWMPLTLLASLLSLLVWALF